MGISGEAIISTGAVEILGGLLQVQAHAGQVFIAGQVEVPQRLGNLLVINGFLHCNHLRHAKSSRERFSLSFWAHSLHRPNASTFKKSPRLPQIIHFPISLLHSTLYSIVINISWFVIQNL